VPALNCSDATRSTLKVASSEVTYAQVFFTRACQEPCTSATYLIHSTETIDTSVCFEMSLGSRDGCIVPDIIVVSLPVTKLTNADCLKGTV
jgi:hypothetical protein